MRNNPPANSPAASIAIHTKFPIITRQRVVDGRVTSKCAEITGVCRADVIYRLFFAIIIFRARTARGIVDALIRRQITTVTRTLLAVITRTNGSAITEPAAASIRCGAKFFVITRQAVIDRRFAGECGQIADIRGANVIDRFFFAIRIRGARAI